MMREVLSQFPFTTLVLTGQLIFFSIFVGALFWVFRPGSKRTYQHLENLPFEGERNEK